MELKGESLKPKLSTGFSSSMLQTTQLITSSQQPKETSLPFYDLHAADSDLLLAANYSSFHQYSSLSKAITGCHQTSTSTKENTHNLPTPIHMSNMVGGGAPPTSPQLESFISSYLNLPSIGTGEYYTNPLDGSKNVIPAAPQDEFFAAGISLLSKSCYGSEQLVEGVIGHNMAHEHEMLGGSGKKRKRGKGGGSDGGIGNHHSVLHQGLEKPKEVIHVRAKRGQATDSHSLAERVRRERINEKLRVLQDLVPGCYKTMGMAVMLDVIINYVQSLQNQIEFLSMKLSAASLFYDFNSPEAEAVEALQLRTNNSEAREMERIQQAREHQQQYHHHQGNGNGGGVGLFSTAAATTTTDGDHLQSMWRY